MTSLHLTTSYSTAKANMDFDRHLHLSLPHHTSILRAYEWQAPSITYPDRQTPHPDLAHLDHSPRPTGGGIVFHGKGDVVLCIITPLPSHLSPKWLHHAVHAVSVDIQRALNQCGIPTHHSKKPSPDAPNREFCKAYFSPSELYCNGEKICGLTIKKYKNHLMIQGIIHLTDAQTQFKNIPAHYHDYMCPTTLPVSARQVIEALFTP